MKNKLFTMGLAVLALVLGVVGGQYIRASQTQAATPTPGHVGANGMREELLSGDTAEKVKAAALKAVPGGIIDRVETDAEGDVYEAHMTTSDGSRVTVKFDSNFTVTKTESGPDGHNRDKSL